jgi:hypothetical protein
MQVRFYDLCTINESAMIAHEELKIRLEITQVSLSSPQANFQGHSYRRGSCVSR